MASSMQCAADTITVTDTTPIIMTPTSILAGAALHVFVVGAGGNGARVVPPLMQMLRQGDAVHIIDHDIVEDRNLARQHFAPGDIGTPKAAVLARRYARRGITSSAHIAALTEQTATTLLQAAYTDTTDPNQRAMTHHPSIIILGCVDNAAARRAIHAAFHTAFFTSSPMAWIDVGNETRGGQVLLSLRQWPLTVVCGARHPQLVWSMHGLSTAMPQLLRGTAAQAAQPACAERIDLQTVQVNHLASAAMLNCMSWLLRCIPFGSCGSFFDTLNTMQPFKIAAVTPSRFTIHPATTYAFEE